MKLKKFLALLLALMLAFSLVACSGAGSDEKDDGGKSSYVETSSSEDKEASEDKGSSEDKEVPKDNGPSEDKEASEDEGSYEDALKIYERYLKGDIKTNMLSKTCPMEILASFVKEYPYLEGMAPSSIYASIEDHFDNYASTSTAGVVNITFAKVKVNSEEKMSEGDLAYLKKTYKDKGAELELTGGYTLDCTITRNNETFTRTLTMLKVDGVWYCLNSWELFENTLKGDFYW